MCAFAVMQGEVGYEEDISPGIFMHATLPWLRQGEAGAQAEAGGLLRAAAEHERERAGIVGNELMRMAQSIGDPINEDGGLVRLRRRVERRTGRRGEVAERRRPRERTHLFSWSNVAVSPLVVLEILCAAGP